MIENSALLLHATDILVLLVLLKVIKFVKFMLKYKSLKRVIITSEFQKVV